MVWVPILVFICISWLLLHKITNRSQDAKEPPLIPQKLPYIGHLLNLVRGGSQYYTTICSKFSLPIYTLQLPGKKIYVVSSPTLVAAVDRHAKTISFAPYIVEFVKRMLVPSPRALEIVKANLHEEKNSLGCRAEILKAMHVALAPGKDLENTTQVFLCSVSSALEAVSGNTDTKSFRLFSWVRKLVTRASTDAIYGASQNPFQDPAVEAGLWAVDKDFALLGLNIFPGVLAPGGHQGRQTVFRGFQQYYAQDGHKKGSRLVQARFEVHRKYDVPASDMEHFDLSVCYGLLVNTVPAVSWVLYYIYSQPSLLKDVRATVAPHVGTFEDDVGSCRYHVNIAEIVANCTLLSSVVHETLRVHSTNASGRVILKDTLIEDKYLLKQDSMLLIPSAELHTNSSVWGTSPNIFDPRRFLQKRKDGAKSSAYRAFGGGASVCPGRFLATNEIIIILVIMVLRYELYPMRGHWSKLESRPHIQTSILTPVEDIHVEIVERKGYENTSWTFVWDAQSTGVQSSL